MGSEWMELMEGHRFDQALAALHRVVEVPLSDPDRMNLATTHMCLSQPAIALEILEPLLSELRTDGGFNLAGACRWALGDRGLALSLWQDATKCRYSDEAGGATPLGLLYYGGSKTGDKRLLAESVRRLKKLSATRRAGFWPGPTAGFLAGRMSSEELFRRADHPVTPLAQRQRCQAYFWHGVLAEASGDTRAAEESYSTSARQGGPAFLEVEYFLALHELGLCPSSD